jgi:hypothetical protein
MKSAQKETECLDEFRIVQDRYQWFAAGSYIPFLSEYGAGQYSPEYRARTEKIEQKKYLFILGPGAELNLRE